MHKKFQWRRYLVAVFTGIFAVAGFVVAVEAPAKAANDLGYNSTVDFATQLNGTSQYWSVAEGTAFDARNTYTASAWFKLDSLNPAGDHMIISHDGDYAIGIRNGIYTAWIYYNGTGNLYTLTSSYAPVVGSWTHIALTRSGTAVKMFLNGSEISSVALPSANPSTYTNEFPIKIGWHYNTSFFPGQIDEVKIWSEAKLAAQIADDMHAYQSSSSATSNLIAFWDFNEGSGTTVYNRVGTASTNLTGNSNPGFTDVKSTTQVGKKTVVSFPRSYLTPVGGWTVPLNMTKVQALVVAGGGAGGSGGDSVGAGGGGAGGYLETVTSTTPGNSVRVVVGQGGLPNRTTWWQSGNNGQNSSFSQITSIGGGGGGGGRASSGSNGGSGGGSGGRFTTSTGGMATTDQGYPGGAGPLANFGAGAGGGGAGSAGQIGGSSSGGAAGAGKTSSISGTAVTYSAGGRGGDKSSSAAVSNASANTGNGGSGSGGGFTQAAPTSTWGVGAAGGSGIVVISYAPSDDRAIDVTSKAAYAKTTSQFFPTSTTQDFTFEAWVKPRTLATNTWQPIVTTPGDSTFTNRFFLGTIGAKIGFANGQGQDRYSTNSLRINEWTHIALSFSGGTVSFYINGNLDSTWTITRVAHAAGLSVGYSDNTGTTQFFDGQIDQVKYWTSALTQSDIARSMHAFIDTDSTQINNTLRNSYSLNELSGSVDDQVGSLPLSLVGSPGRADVVTSSSTSTVTTYKFTRTVLNAWGGWVPGGTVTANILAVAGGGGGGSPHGGGGGAGGLASATSISLSGVVPIKVGQGGLGQALTGVATCTPNKVNFSGQSSTIGSITVPGGGAGAMGCNGASSQSTNTQGGSGGGGAYVSSDAANYRGATTIPSNSGTITYYGNVGSYGAYNSGADDQFLGGGGGGAGSAAVDGSSASAGSGGSGFKSNISGSDVCYAAGGGGGAGSAQSGTAGAGGTCSGMVTTAGAGSRGQTRAADAVANTGSGGGGGGYEDRAGGDLTGAAGNGGSGVVIAAVSTAQTVSFDANTGSGSLATQYINTGSSANLTSIGTAITKSGYTFAGWATTSGGSVVYPDGGSITPTGDMTLYAKWTANTLTVTFNSQGGSSVADGSVATGASISSAPTAPTRNGYTFAGWFAASSGGSAITFPYAHGQTANFTLYAQWTANTLNVTWNSNSGSTVSDTTTTTGVSIASAPASPTRAGYTFAGWYEQSGLTSQAVFPNYVHGRTADFTLYAKWTANPTRTITYSLAGGSSTLPTQSAVQEGLSFSVAGTPVKFGYTFTGWSDGTNSYLGGTTYIVGSSNITLTATWSADILNVTWNSNGGSAVSGTTTVTGGTISSAPTAPTKLGYNFAGWFEESGLSTEAIFPNYIHGRGTSFTLYAKWTAATYTITYKAGTSGTGSDLTQTFVYGNSISIKDATAPLTRAGYSISGWAATDGGLQTKALSASYSSAADLTLYPVWSANTNTVSYDVQGGSSVSSGSFTTGSTLTLPAASVRSGYTFQGWYTAATGGTKVGNANATISPPNTSDVTLYAQWVAVNYSVTYDANTAASGSVPTDTNNYNVGGDHIVRGNSGSLAKTGYAFGGWTTNSNGTGTVYNSGEVYTFADASVTFYAKWLANTYTITYNSNGATSGSPTSTTQTYTSGNAGVTLTTVGSLEKTGYTFGGWSIVAGGAALSGPYTTSADVTLYAVWNIKTVSITYAKGIASAAAFTDFPALPQTATFAVRASLASNVDILVSVASATYRFVGWSDGSSIYAAGSTYLLGDTDVTMTAQWVRVLQVRYTLNGGTGVLPGDDECITDGGGGIFLCDANQVITASVAPNRTGYEFAGWKDQNNFTIAAGATFTVTSSKYLLYAQWTPVNYTVTYVSNGGATAPTETAKNIGDIFTVANAITRTGYSFNGWSDGSRNYGAGASYQVGSTNVTLTAQWVADVYTITFDWNGGTGTASANGSYTVGTSGLTLPSVGDHVKDGYSFAGWSETRNGTALTGAYQPTQSRTLYAVWGSGSYTVTYDANGGTAATASASVVNGGSTLLPSATRANYVFEGWYSAQTGGSSRGVAAGVFTPTGSTTLYARWTQLSLYGINPVHLTRVGTLTASGINSSYSGSNAGSSVQVTVPANTLPTGTTVNLDLVSDFTRAGNLLNDPANFIVSLVVSWVASDGTVPNTYSGKAVSVTIQNSSIKAGSSVYSILGSQVTLLGTAILDGTVTVSLTQDPEIVIAATKPTAPQTVTAVAGQTGTANVSWSAPSSNGGATITSYTVTASTGQTCTTVITSCAVTGLTSGATYTFTVTATNSVGTSAASAASSALSLNSAPISSPNSGSPNIGGPVVKAPITSNDRGQQIFEVSQKKVATTGGSVLKIDTKNMEDISNVTVNGKKAKILGIVDGEIKLQMPTGTKGEAKLVFSGPTGTITMEKVISFVAPKPVDVVTSAAMPQGVWTIATPAVQALRKTLLANPDTVLINCVGYQSYAYNTPFDAVVAKQRAKNACAYLASQAPGVAVKTSVVRTKLTGPASRKLKVTFSAVR